MNLTHNNISVNVAKSLAKDYGMVKEKKRNVFIINGGKYCFSISWKSVAECRQFYDDCDGVIILNVFDYTIYKFERGDGVSQKSSNRTSPKSGIPARTFTSKYPDGVKFAYAEFDENTGNVTFFDDV